MLHRQEKKDTYNSTLGERRCPPRPRTLHGDFPQTPALFVPSPHQSLLSISEPLLPFRISSWEQVPFGALEIRQLLPTPPPPALKGVSPEQERQTLRSAAPQVWITAPRAPPQMRDKYLKLPKPWKQRLFKVILHTHKRKRKWRSEAAPPPLRLLSLSLCLWNGPGEQGEGKRKRKNRGFCCGASSLHEACCFSLSVL